MRTGKILAVMTLVLTSVVMGTAIGFSMGINPWVPIAVIIGGSIVISKGMNLVGTLATLVGTHTGATSYSGSIESPTARLYIFGDSATAISTLNAVKLTLTQATKRKTGTLIPELTFDILADIAAYIDGVIYEDATAFYKKFSIPVSLGGSYDLEGGALSYTLTGATAGDTIKVYAIDDAKRELDYIEIVPLGCIAGSVKTIDAVNCAYFFADPTNVTRLKVTYANGTAIEYLGEEITEIARVMNPVHKGTLAGLFTMGFGTLAGMNIMDAVNLEVNLTANGTVYLVKHLSAEK